MLLHLFFGSAIECTIVLQSRQFFFGTLDIKCRSAAEKRLFDRR